MKKRIGQVAGSAANGLNQAATGGIKSLASSQLGGAAPGDAIGGAKSLFGGELGAGPGDALGGAKSLFGGELGAGPGDALGGAKSLFGGELGAGPGDALGGAKSLFGSELGSAGPAGSAVSQARNMAAGPAAGGGAQAAGAASSQDINLEELADILYRKLRSELRLENERTGRKIVGR
jgi:hypothetical protein